MSASAGRASSVARWSSVGLIAALVLSGCSRPAAAPAATGAGVSPPASASTLIEAEPITYAPDNMWAFLASMPGLQRRSDTLQEATAFADVVVIGRYAGVERGGQYGADSTAVALIKTDSVLKGSPALDRDGLLRAEFVLVVGSPTYPEKELADLQRSIPTEPALLYLFSWESFFELTGDTIPGWAERSDLSTVYKTIGGDGAMRVVNGRILPPPYVDGWAAGLADRQVSEVIAEIEATAGG